MVLTQFEYEAQAANARAAIGKIEEKIFQVKKALAQNPDCATLRRELRNLTMDMTITLNELEHAESALEQLDRYNLSSRPGNHELFS